MKLRKAARSHVRDVRCSPRAPRTPRAHNRRFCSTQSRYRALLSFERAHADLTRGPRSFHRQVHFRSGLMHERLMRLLACAQRPAVNSRNHAPASSWTPGPQRASLVGAQISAKKTVDAVAAGASSQAKSAPGNQRVVGRLTMIAAGAVRVRCAELALHFQNQVVELRAAVDAFDERHVALQHSLPVDLRHVGPPEMIALQPPRLVQHLLPFRFRLDQHFQPLQIDPAARARLGAFIFDLFAAFKTRGPLLANNNTCFRSADSLKPEKPLPSVSVLSFLKS